MESFKKTLKVPLDIHWSTAILLILFLYVFGWVVGTFCFTLVMLSLLVHEYCHVWMALRKELKVTKVIVFALGAGALIDSDELMEDSNKGLKVVLAGPLGSLLLAVIALPLYLLLPNFATSYFLLINIAFTIFNLLPLFPSDGGRIMYFLLRKKTSSKNAINISVYISYALCLIGTACCIALQSWLMLFVFVFIALFAKSEQRKFIQRENKNVVKDEKEDKDIEINIDEELKIAVAEVIKLGKEYGVDSKEVRMFVKEHAHIKDFQMLAATCLYFFKE